MSKVHATFITSAADPKGFPPEGDPELAIVGRSNVGKSSLINAMLGSDLARTSRTPGRTRLLNWFAVASKPAVALVDLPGYGYASVGVAMRESWRPLIDAYLTSRQNLACVVLLIDIRRGTQEEELDFVAWLEEQKTPFVIALTKSDKLAKNKRMLEVQRVKAQLGLTRPPYAVSAQTNDGVEQLWRALLSLASPKK